MPSTGVTVPDPTASITTTNRGVQLGPPAPMDAPQGGDNPSFGTWLVTAESAFVRKQSQMAFLLGGGARSIPPGGSDVDCGQRQLVLRNAAAGLAPASGASPLPELTPLETASRAPASMLPSTPGPIAAIPAPAGAADLTPLGLEDFPRPVGDNGRGVHWIPTLHSTPETVDRFVQKAADMHMKWVVLLNDGVSIGDNDYLVKRLVANGIMPVMRVFTNGLQPIGGDVESFVRHYTAMGVSYFQLYNEPNLMVETHGQPPDVGRYLDLWIPAAKRVVAAGGLPGIGALSPQGEMDDRQFLSGMLDDLLARGEGGLLDRTWLAVHNYTGPRPMSDPDGFLRFRQYDAIARAKLGRSLPMVGTEGGTHVGPGVDERQQVDMVMDAYRYMSGHPDPYNFSYTYWIIANEAGGGRDSSFRQHALYREDGPTALAQALSHDGRY